jgi:hypothetical protein
MCPWVVRKASCEFAIPFGAGASHGSIDCTPRLPPLGSQLLGELFRWGVTAAALTPAQRKQFEDNFENGMVEALKEPDFDGVSFVREMASYFVQFKPGPNNLYRRLLAAIRSARRSVVLSTTNYDLLIEHAARDENFFIAHTIHDVPADNIALLKLHGSCHFLPDLESTNSRIRGIRFSGLGLQPTGARISLLNAPVRAATTSDEILRWCDTEDALCPAMTFYAPGKVAPVCPEFIASQQTQWRDSLSVARVIFIVGLSVLPDDNHIWDPIAASKARVEYVGLEPDKFLSWTAMRGRRNAHVLAKTFAEALPLISIHLRH